jgi:hypothetical protein
LNTRPLPQAVLTESRTQLGTAILSPLFRLDKS